MQAEPRYHSAIERVLDVVGTSLTPDSIKTFVDVLGPHLGPGAGAPYAELRLQFVLDSSIAQAVLRYHLKGGRSGILDGLSSGILRPIAPPLLDTEIREHVPRMAAACHVSETTVLEAYEKHLAPYIEFRKPSAKSRSRARRKIADKDDVDFLAISIESGISTIASADNAFAVDSEVVVLRIKDLAEIHLTFRKGTTALLTMTMVGSAVAGVTVGLVRAVQALVRAVLSRPQILLYVLGALLLLSIIFPDQRKRIVEGTRSSLGTLGEGLVALAPVLLQAVVVAGGRLEAASALARQLEARSPSRPRNVDNAAVRP